MKNIDIFTPELKFTERGSRSLWKEMAGKVVLQSNINASNIKQFLYSQFYKFTGHKIIGDDYTNGSFFYVEKYDPGHGSSSGVISPTWWVMIGIPVLANRFREGHSPYSLEGKYINDIYPKYLEKMKGVPLPRHTLGESGGSNVST